MVLLAGTGLVRLGWRHREDGSATATEWLRLAYFPIAPLRRARYALNGSPGRREPGLRGSLAHWSGASWSEVSTHRLEGTPLDLGEVVGTYARTYALLPLAMLSPFLGLGCFHLLQALVTGRSTPLALDDIPLFLGLAVCVFFGSLIVAVRRSQAIPPRPLPRRERTAARAESEPVTKQEERRRPEPPALQSDPPPEPSPEPAARQEAESSATLHDAKRERRARRAERRAERKAARLELRAANAERIGDALDRRPSLNDRYPVGPRR